jgi:hypothetical protein
MPGTGGSVPSVSGRKRAVAGIRSDTVTKAREDLSDGAIQPTTQRTSAGNRIHLAVSSDGTMCYLTTIAECTCRVGLKGKYMCRHRAAVILRNA